MRSLIEILKSVGNMTKWGSYQYEPLDDTRSRQSRLDMFNRIQERRHKIFKVSAVGAILLVVCFLAFYMSREGTSRQGCEQAAHCLHTSKHTWGQYSPYFSVPSDISPSIPDGCTVTFAQVLSRHGSRAPTAKKLDLYESTLKRIQATVERYGTGFDFIKDYQPHFIADELTAFGEQELVESGEQFYQRYQQLADSHEPFMRAAGSNRVIVSARNFSQGFYQQKGSQSRPFEDQILIIPEEEGYNNTLDRSGCPAFDSGLGSKRGHEKQAMWKSKWAAPLLERLNHRLPGANLSLDETVYIMDLCPFNTVSRPDGSLSKFCRLFSRNEWRGYDYYESLEKWYVYGPGRDLGATQGVGYVNELLSRLTGKPVQDHTTTNSTLDSSPITFPLDRKLYADFSHDNTMMSIFAALGIYNATQNLPTDHKVPPLQTGGFSASWAVPFASRMYVEKMQCANEPEELVRIVLNNRVVPLRSCAADGSGRCKLSTFVKSQSFARNGGHWNTCFP